ncbi:hypothetical protein ABZ802_29135 [Streptomyces sp. NPDC047737]|jgi:hypothetical protein|uniref:hypothetical protein n=1 Tax=unclassified Streptomyces TaxID=2593676 RepID=UPI0034102F4D
MRISASLRSRSIRTGTTVAAAVAAAGVVALAGAPAAQAVGESGDIDIRSVSWHSRGDRNGVEVCQFVLAANNFGELPLVVWTITERPPGNTLTNTLPLANGQGRSQEYLLPEGTYQLTWTVGTLPKQKSFEVDCSERGRRGDNADGAGRGGSDTGAQADKGSEKGSAEKGSAEIYDKPSGAVPAGGGGVPDMESVSSESDSNVGTSAALVAGAAGIAGLIMVRRTARRRARNEV